jgi:hypothetical protein
VLDNAPDAASCQISEKARQDTPHPTLWSSTCKVLVLEKGVEQAYARGEKTMGNRFMKE